jgi:predicted porin
VKAPSKTVNSNSLDSLYVFIGYQMKKTLVAMAVLAASGATMAQVTITGTLATGYKMSSTSSMAPGAGGSNVAALANQLMGGTGGNPVGDSSGFGLDTTEIVFTAVEDLGGGSKVTAAMTIDTLSRQSVAGGNASLKMLTSVGQFTLQTYKPVDFLSRGTSGVGGVDMEDKVFQKRGLNDSVGYDAKFGPVVFGFSHNEQASATNSSTSGTGMGLGVGAAGSSASVGQRNNSYALTYIGGPLVATVNYIAYDNRTDNTLSSYKDVIRANGSYDLGVAKLGAGLSQITTMTGTTLETGLIAFSVPFGALTVGGNFASATARGVPAVPGFVTANQADQTRTGYSFTADYALSKRTSFNVGYANWLASGGLDRNNQFTTLLTHTF